MRIKPPRNPAGKGPRIAGADPKKFRAGYENINWGRKKSLTVGRK